MSNNKKFKYGGDDDSATDSFIASIVKEAPSSSKKEEEMVTKERFDDWYAGANNYNAHTDKDSGNRGSNIGLYILNGLFALIGLALIVGGVVISTSDRLKFCEDCKTLALVPIGFGVLLCLVAAMGIYGTLHKSTCLLMAYSGIQVLILLALLATLITGIIFTQTSLNLGPAWKQAVKTSPKLICDVQEAFSCSGFSDGCCAPPLPNITFAPSPSPRMRRMHKLYTLAGSTNDTNATNATACYTLDPSGYAPTWVNETCVPTCTNNQFRTLCSAALKQSIVEKMWVFVGILGGTIFLLAIGISLVCRRKSA